MTDAERMKQVRKKLGMTQPEFARVIGFSSAQAIANVETGQRGLSSSTRKLLEYVERFGKL